MSTAYLYYCPYDGQESEYGFRNQPERAEALLRHRHCLATIHLADPWLLWHLDCGKENQHMVQFLIDHRLHFGIGLYNEYDKRPEAPKFRHVHSYDVD